MIIEVIFLIGLSFFLVYLSISDIKSHEIPFLASIAALVFSVVFIFIINITNLNSGEILPDLSNAFKGLIVGGGLAALVVILSGEKALGMGDIILFGIMGVSVGLPNLLIAFLLAVYSATFYGVFLAIKNNKFRGLEVPLVPFISFGIIGAILFSGYINDFLQRFTLLSILG